MAPLVGLFAAATIAGAGAALGWRLVRDHLLPAVGATRKEGRNGNGEGQVIDAEYVDVTDGRGPAGARRGRQDG